MKLNRTVLWLVVLSMCISGCFTLSEPEIRQIQRSVLDTHRRVAKLEDSTSVSVREMQNETRATRADVGENLKELQDELRRTGEKVEENTYQVRQLTAKLDEILYSLQAAQETIPQERVVKPADIEVEEPEETPTEAPTDTEKPEAAVPPPLLKPVSPEEDYRRAKRDYDRGNLEIAKLEFDEYLRNYPDSELAPNAQFWLAECHFKSGDFRTAVTEFKKVYTEFPHNNKVPDAMLNEAYAHDRLGEREEAVRLLRKIISQYGDSPGHVAESAKIKLESLGESVDE